MAFIVARRPCCKSIVMSCVKGYEDAQSMRDFGKYAAEGCIVETVEGIDPSEFKRCDKCPAPKKERRPIGPLPTEEPTAVERAKGGGK